MFSDFDWLINWLTLFTQVGFQALLAQRHCTASSLTPKMSLGLFWLSPLCNSPSLPSSKVNRVSAHGLGTIKGFHLPEEGYGWETRILPPREGCQRHFQFMWRALGLDNVGGNLERILCSPSSPCPRAWLVDLQPWARKRVSPQPSALPLSGLWPLQVLSLSTRHLSQRQL